MSDVQGFAPVVSALRRMDKDSRHDWATEQLGICIAKQIREIRTQRGWTQKQLAERCGLAQSYINRLETPKHAIHATTTMLCRVAAGLECAFMIRFVSWSEFVVYVLVITGSRVEVKRFADEEEFWK